MSVFALDRGLQGKGHISALNVTCPKVEVACERVKSLDEQIHK